MARLSIGKAWDEARAVLARDRGPIATVALALIVLPGTLAELIVPPAAPDTQPALIWSLVSLFVLLVSLLGQLTISRIALGVRQSVGEALAHGVRRLPPLLVSILIWLLPFALIASPFALQVQANPTAPPPGATVPLLAIALVFMVIAIRLILSTPIAANENVGPLGILKRSWNLTAGNWWRLFGFLALFMIAALIALGALTAVVGVAVSLVAGEPERLSVGALILALVTQIMAALITVLLTVIVARVYLQLAGDAEEPVSVPHAP